MEIARILRRINLNLLPILAELLRCASVSQAAERLHLTQSTISGSLKQLRVLFGDQLLAPSGRQMVLTKKASQLLPEIERIMKLAEHLFENESFEPRSSTTNFRIATADYVSALVTSRLGTILQQDAPNVTISLTPTPGMSAKELRLGYLDLIICPNRAANWNACGISPDDPEFRHDAFMRDSWTAVRWSEDADAEERLTLEEYCSRPHVVYCRTDGHQTIEEETLGIHGIAQRTRFRVPYFTLIPRLVVGSDLIGLVPRSLALHFQEAFPLNLFAPPIDFPDLELVMIWSALHDQNSDSIWL